MQSVMEHADTVEVSYAVVELKGRNSLCNYSSVPDLLLYDQ